MKFEILYYVIGISCLIFLLVQVLALIHCIHVINGNDWLITVVAWELVNLSLYLLVSINGDAEAALSAALKYFLISALTTTFLLLAVALLYALTGCTHYDPFILSLFSFST